MYQDGLDRELFYRETFYRLAYLQQFEDWTNLKVDRLPVAPLAAFGTYWNSTETLNAWLSPEAVELAEMFIRREFSGIEGKALWGTVKERVNRAGRQGEIERLEEVMGVRV